MEQLSKKLGFSKVFIGILFFLNPLLSFVDILPDFIGCLFLLSGLSPLLFLDVRAQSARRHVRLLALLSVARFLCTPVFFWSGTQDGGNTNLLVSFAFGVVSILLELSLFRELSELYNYLSVRCDSSASIPYLDPAFSLLTIFAVAKNVAAMLPDFLTLFSPDSLLEYNPGSAQAAASFAFAKSVSYVALFAAVFIFGIVVWVRLGRYYRTVATEAGYLNRIREASEQAESGERRLRLKFDLTNAFSLLVFLALFSFDYYLDYVSVLPAPVAFVLGMLLLKRLTPYRTPKKAEYAFFTLGALVSAAAYVYRMFYSQDTFVGVTFHTRPFTVVFGVLQALLLFSAFLLASRAAVQAVKKETGVELYSERNLACVLSFFSAAMCAYHYILPKGPAVTDLTETISFFALVFGALFVASAWRIDSAFRKATEWRFL